MSRLVMLVLLAGCGSRAVQAPATAPAETDDAPVVRTWIVAEHVVVKGASVSQADAEGFHGRTLDITARGYMSPWQGTCARATRTERERPLAEVLAELGVIAADRAKVAAFGLPDATIEYRLVCDESAKPIPLTVFVGGDRAMTCFGGACYLLNRF